MRKEYDFSNARPNPYIKGLTEALEYQQGTLEVRETTLTIEQPELSMDETIAATNKALWLPGALRAKS